MPIKVSGDVFEPPSFQKLQEELIHFNCNVVQVLSNLQLLHNTHVKDRVAVLPPPRKCDTQNFLI